MARISNGIVTCVNVITLLLAFSAIGFSVWFHVKSDSACQRVIRMPLLIVGGALAVVSLVGLLGACYRVSFLLWLYLFVLFLLIIGLTGFTIFTIIVTNKGVGKALSGKGAGHNRLGDYSGWLQKHVVNAQNWDQIKSCLADVKLCQSIEGGKGEDYYKYKLSPIKSGCCKPPNYCGFQFQNATNWAMPDKGPAMPDPDCKTWSNAQDHLCFNCESCKAAVLENIKRDWRMLALINICLIIFVVIVYSIGCCAFRSSRYSSKKHRGYA